MDDVPGTCLGHSTVPAAPSGALHMVILTIRRDNRHARRPSAIWGPLMVGPTAARLCAIQPISPGVVATGRLSSSVAAGAVVRGPSGPVGAGRRCYGLRLKATAHLSWTSPHIDHCRKQLAPTVDHRGALSASGGREPHGDACLGSTSRTRLRAKVFIERQDHAIVCRARRWWWVSAKSTQRHSARRAAGRTRRR